MPENQQLSIDKLHTQVLDFCRHVAGSNQIAGISLFDNCAPGSTKGGAAVETVLVIRDFQPRLMSYPRLMDGRYVVVIAVDQWIFERDIERGFLGEASVGTLVFPYVAIFGEAYLHEQEIKLKQRLILELIENLALGFPELSNRLRIQAEYFMYEIMLNRVRVFPPMAYCAKNFVHSSIVKKKQVLDGYNEAVNQLAEKRKIALSEGFVMIPRELVKECRSPRVRWTNMSKVASRAIFTSIFEAFPQLLNFFSERGQAILKFQKISWKRPLEASWNFVDPLRYVFVPTAKGLVSLADSLDVEHFAKKMLLNGEKGEVKVEAIGGVLNDVFLVRAFSGTEEKKVVVKRFKDWSGVKWFPLTLWTLGTRTFAVLGRSRLEKECAISELLRSEGFNVPKVLHISHGERMVFMEHVDGENLSNAIKRIAASKTLEKAETDLTTIARVGEIFAKVHSLNVALGDTKPENAVVSPTGEIFLLDFEQASQEGDKTWDVAEFLYYSGHYLPPLQSNDKARIIAEAFIAGYLRGGGDPRVVRQASASKYTRVFSVFTAPSVIFAISNACRKAGTQKEEKA